MTSGMTRFRLYYSAGHLNGRNALRADWMSPLSSTPRTR